MKGLCSLNFVRVASDAFQSVFSHGPYLVDHIKIIGIGHIVDVVDHTLTSVLEIDGFSFRDQQGHSEFLEVVAVLSRNGEVR